MCLSLKLYDAKCDCPVVFRGIPSEISVDYVDIQNFRGLFGPEGITKFFGVRASESLPLIEQGLKQNSNDFIVEILKQMYHLAKNGGKSIWVVS
jgi:hypothetical protein